MDIWLSSQAASTHDSVTTFLLESSITTSTTHSWAMRHSTWDQMHLGCLLLQRQALAEVSQTPRLALPLQHPARLFMNIMLWMLTTVIQATTSQMPRIISRTLIQPILI